MLLWVRQLKAWTQRNCTTLPILRIRRVLRHHLGAEHLPDERAQKTTQTKPQKPAAKKAKPPRTNPKNSTHKQLSMDISPEKNNNLASLVEEPHHEKAEPKNAVKSPGKKPSRKKAADPNTPKKADKLAAGARNTKSSSDSSQEQEKQQQRAARSQVLARYNDEKTPGKRTLNTLPADGNGTRPQNSPEHKHGGGAAGIFSTEIPASWRT